MSSLELQRYCIERVGLYNCVNVDGRYLPPDYYIEIPCGVCFGCLKRRRLEWSFRLLNELDQHSENVFVTLTFEDKYLEEFKDDYKRPLKLYIDRLRKALGYRPRYWFHSELGDAVHHTGRLHFHGIFFGTSAESFSFADMHAKWPYGNVWTGYVNSATASYITKYMLKQQREHKPVLLCSNGIGSSYVSDFDRMREKHLNNFDPRFLLERYGRLYPMPTYYKNKLFDEDLKLCFMLSRYNSREMQHIWLNGTEYTDMDMYKLARDSWMAYAERLGLNKARNVKLDKSKIYAKLHHAEG